MNAKHLPSNHLGRYLRDRRAQLDPAALGFKTGRRRTPGLRREEVAQRAHISATWYTWLEQGRGGAPSPAVLDRLAGALMLTDAEREHLFLIALGREPIPQFRRIDDVTPRLQRILDALVPFPAVVRTATWDVLAWNKAARVVLADFDALPQRQRNVLRMLFLDPEARKMYRDWEELAHFIVGTFRIDAARAQAAGAAAEVVALVNELTGASPDFAKLWQRLEVPDVSASIKRLHHPKHGTFIFEHSTFAVDGRPDLTLVVFSPLDPADAERLMAVLELPQPAVSQDGRHRGRR